MTHLTRDELVAWRDRPSDGERARVTEHLGACRPCASVYAELLRTAPVEQPAHFNPADFVQRGYAVRRSSASAPAWISAMSSWKAWGGALTAATALVLIVSVGTRLNDDPDMHLRGTGIELTAPAAAGRPIVLAWSTGLAATSFSVEIKDASGSLVHRAATAEKTVTLPDTVAAALRPGQTYTWTVTALDASGQSITSASSTFVAGAAGR
jgi:hypothetical protein